MGNCICVGARCMDFSFSHLKKRNYNDLIWFFIFDKFNCQIVAVLGMHVSKSLQELVALSEYLEGGTRE